MILDFCVKCLKLHLISYKDTSFVSFGLFFHSLVPYGIDMGLRKIPPCPHHRDFLPTYTTIVAIPRLLCPGQSSSAAAAGRTSSSSSRRVLPPPPSVASARTGPRRPASAGGGSSGRTRWSLRSAPGRPPPPPSPPPRPPPRPSAGGGASAPGRPAGSGSWKK